jgi:hypothetical protein
VLLSSGDSFPHLIQKRRSQLGFVTYLLNYLRIRTRELAHGGMGDARKLGERNLRNGARNRDSPQKLLKKALAQKVLLCQ